MSTRLEAIQKTRLTILHRNFGRLCDPTDPYSVHELKGLRQRFAVNASVLKIPDEHKWILKLTNFFDSISAAITPRQRESQYKTVEQTFRREIDMFKMLAADNFEIEQENPGTQPRPN